MSLVLGTNTLEKVGYRFINGLFGTQVLQVGFKRQDWDTNSGLNEGPPYTEWRDADRYEAEAFLVKSKEQYKG